jgi:hypothetical protein
VLVDVAVAIADGATTISDVQVLADQQRLHGPAGRSGRPRRSGGSWPESRRRCWPMSGRPGRSPGTGRGCPRRVDRP